jgi:transposase
MAKRIDYSGKKVNVGIDVHKKSYAVCCRCEGEVVKRATVPAVPEKLVEFLRFHFAGAAIHSAYEAGFSGFVLHRALEANGIKNIVVNPSSIEVAANDKAKTDKRDARKISEQLETGRLKGIVVPTVEQEQERLVTRTREQLVRERSRIGNQFKSRLFQFGLIPHNDETVMSKAFIDDYIAQQLPQKLHEALSVLARVWKLLDAEVKALSRKMAAIGVEEKAAILYQSVPGIGPITSVVLALELGDMSQFRNERGIFKHTGLIPSEFSSGPHIRKGHITRQGSSRLRHLLTEAAWKAIQKDPKLAADFNRIARKRGKKRAIVAIARKLIGRIRACFRKEQSYQVGFGMAA